MGINNLLLIFPESELNDILIHAVPNGWAIQSYPQGLTYRETCAMFEQMDIDEQVYNVKSPS